MLDADKAVVCGIFPDAGALCDDAWANWRRCSTRKTKLARICMWLRCRIGAGAKRTMTGLPWIAPSPNLPATGERFLYPGIEILQAGGVSVGRGTDSLFGISARRGLRRRAVRN